MVTPCPFTQSDLAVLHILMHGFVCPNPPVHSHTGPGIQPTILSLSMHKHLLSYKLCASLVQGIVSRGLAWLACGFVLHGWTESNSCEEASGPYIIRNDHTVTGREPS